MIEFKKNVKKLLPYDRKNYINYLNWKEAINSPTYVKWYDYLFRLPGVSTDVDIIEPNVPKFLKAYEPWFENVILQLDTGSPWIVNHSKRNGDWLPNKQRNLIQLRALFEERDIPNTFRGAITFSKEDLLKYAKDIISYPYAVINGKKWHYSNLDISHAELPFIITTRPFLYMNILSTDKKLLKKVVKENSSSSFDIIENYRNKVSKLL